MTPEDVRLEKKAELISTLNQRNTEAVEVFMRRQDVINTELHKRLDDLNTTIVTAYHRISNLERDLALARATSMGHGPTVR